MGSSSLEDTKIIPGCCFLTVENPSSKGLLGGIITWSEMDHIESSKKFFSCCLCVMMESKDARTPYSEIHLLAAASAAGRPPQLESSFIWSRGGLPTILYGHRLVMLSEHEWFGRAGV